MKTLVALLMLTVASQAQDIKMTTNGTMGDGPCTCHSSGGKTWPCRKVRGEIGGSIMAVNRCYGGGYQLSCPADRNGVCQYVMLPPVCTEPPLSDVCFAGDEPK